MRPATQPQRRGLGLLWRFLIALLGISLVPLILLSITALLGYRTASQQASDTAVTLMDDKSLKTQQLRTVETAGAVARFLEARVQDTRAAALLPRTPEAYLALAQTYRSELWYLGGSNAAPVEVRTMAPIYREVAYIDREGREQVRVSDGQVVPPAELRDVSDPANTSFRSETYFAEARGLAPGELYVSPVTARHVTTDAQLRGVDPNTPHLAVEGEKYAGVIRFATPVFDAQGQFDGVVMLSLDHRHIMEFVAHILPTDEQYTVFPDYASGNYAWMFDHEGWQIAHPRLGGLRGLDERGALVAPVNAETPPEQRRNQPFNLRLADWVDPSFRQMYEAVARNETGLQTIVNQAGVERAITYAPIPFAHGVYKQAGLFGGVTLGANVAEFHSDAILVRTSVEAAQDRLQRNILWIGALVIGLIALVAALIARTITRPVLRLTEAAREMAGGTLNAAVLDSLSERSVGDEITELSRVFKQMAVQVQLREKRLQDEIQQLNIQIDEQKASRQVSEITETEYFQNLVDRATQLRQQRKDGASGGS